MTRPSFGASALVASHLLAAILGALAGEHYVASTLQTLEDFNAAATQVPVVDAAELAFRFGSAEDAKALLSRASFAGPSDALQQASRVMRGIRLVVVCEELADENCRRESLLRTMEGCRRTGKRDCSEAGLRRGIDLVRKYRTP